MQTANIPPRSGGYRLFCFLYTKEFSQKRRNNSWRVNKHDLHNRASLSVSLSKQKNACGNNDRRLDKGEKIPGEQEGKQYSRSKAHGASAYQHPEICATHFVLPPTAQCLCFYYMIQQVQKLLGNAQMINIATIALI